jgi:hypothetical protein
MATTPITDEIRAAAQAFLDSGKFATAAQRRSLKAIADPASGRKFIDVESWRWLHGVTPEQVRDRRSAANEALDTKIAAMADPARNPFPHQRKVAEEKLVERKTRREAEAKKPPPSAPGLEEHDRREALKREALERAIEAIRLPRAPPVYGPPKPRPKEPSNETSNKPVPAPPLSPAASSWNETRNV